MSEHFLRYLEREHARLEAELTAEQARPWPDAATVARLKKAKLLVKDQLAQWQRDAIETIAA